LHKALLTHHSEYFRNAFNGSWKEANDKLISLDDVEVVAVDIFANWLYTQQVPNSSEVDSLADLENIDDKYDDDDSTITGYTKALVFGARFMVPLFRKAVHDCIVDTLLPKSNVPYEPPCFTATKYAHENLSPNHKILELLLNYHCRYLVMGETEDDIAEWAEWDLPPMLLIRMVARHSHRASESSGAWWKVHLKRCDYHDHLNDQERKLCPNK
jgi:hypothetical protein